MGFYGNITNTSRTTFQFDKVYPSRYEMDLNCLSDGIYAGRYVLVEYDSDLDQSAYNKPWYRVTAKNGSAKLYEGINFHNPESTTPYLYFESVSGQTVIEADDAGLEGLSTIYLEVGHSFSLLNSDLFFIKLNKNGKYQIVSFTEFQQQVAYIGELTDLSQLSDEEIMGTLPHAHIANEIAAFDSMDVFDDTSVTYKYAVVLPGRYYTYNTEGEFWNILDTTFTENNVTYPTLSQIKTRNNYQINFDNDKTNYKNSRGYDSTVWQKVYANGTEKYVMIAELNTVVPTFGITADAPTLLPLNPHWGSDSTNVYYNLHWQPQWGFRPKAASNVLTGPAIDASGQLYLDADNNLSSQGNYGVTLLRDIDVDSVYYPSDERITWRQTFENLVTENDENRKTLYYNEETHSWRTDSSATIPAAIYYNKAGFDSDKIAYSQDLIDAETVSLGYNRYDQNIARSNWINRNAIRITPSGLSGNTYNQHNGTIDQKSQIDTQEISIMLPGIGDTISNIWDLIYGGRTTNDSIKQKNRRNQDIEWEDAKGALGLRGLRLRGIYGTQYDKNAVNTLAGCINTAHDLFGMIIAPKTTTGLADLGNLDTTKIYYDTDRQSYWRKHLTYDYTPIDGTDDSVYTYDAVKATEEMNQEKIDTGLYYIKDGDNYIVATTYVPGETYYYKTAKTIYTSVDNLVDFPYNNYKWYKEGSDDDLLADYVWNSTYQSGRNYYKVTVENIGLGENYEKDTYFYQTQAGFLLDREETASVHDGGYWTISHDKMTNIKDVGFKGVYTPYTYYFEKSDGSFELDTSPYASMSGAIDDKYYSIKKTAEFKNEDGSTSLYIENTYYTEISLTSSTYIVGVYYIQDEEGKYTVSTEAFNDRTTYYAKNSTYTKVADTTQVQIDTSSYVRKGELCIYQDDTYYIQNLDLTDDTIIGYTTIDRKYIQNNAQDLASKNIYIFAEWTDYNEQNHSPNYMPINKVIEYVRANPNHEKNRLTPVNNFYEKNKYHYIKNDSYILDTSSKKTDGLQYCLIKTVEGPQTGVQYYEKDKYYQETEEEDQYSLITTDTKPASGTIYKKDALYIYSDTTLDPDSRLSKGMEWNIDAKSVPSTITLAKRSERWEMQEMDTYARDISTINGIILKMLQKLELNDDLTREDTNVSGVINQVRDKIARFGRMRSQQLTIIDDNGRLHSAETLFRQNESLITKASNQYVDYTKADIYPTVSSLNKQYKQWITVNIDGNASNPTVTIHHNFQGVSNTTSQTNKNTDNVASNNTSDKIALYTPIVDEMGHVVGKNTETVTLPYGFKTISTNGKGNNVERNDNVTLNTTDIIAENTQDTLILNSGDQWIRIETDPNSDTLTFSHDIHPITTTALTKNFNNDDSGDTFIATDIIHDNAGHITANQNHTYTLPYSWKQISHNGSSEVVTDLIANNTTIIPESCKDTLTINTGNAWIKLAANNKTLTMAHTVNTITTTAKSDTNLDGIGNFTVQDIAWDQAGHITAIQDHKYTLPYNYRNIAVNTGSSSTSATNAADGATTIQADSYNDTLTFIPGNKWITIVADAANDSITIGHAAASTASSTAGDSSNQTPNFNATFKVPYIGIDQVGHVSTLSEHTVTIPTYTVSTSATGNIVTGGSFADTGTLTLSTSKLGGLILSENYSKASVANGITSTDTLNTALGKLEFKVDDSLSKIENLNLETYNIGANETISSIGQSNGQLSVAKQSIQITKSQVIDLVNDLNNLTQSIETIHKIEEEEEVGLLNQYAKIADTYVYQEAVPESSEGAGDGVDAINMTVARLTTRAKELETAIISLVNLIPDTVISQTDKATFINDLELDPSNE